MGASKTRLSKEASRAVSAQLSAALKAGEDPELLLKTLEAKIVDATFGLSSAQSNILYASRQLRGLGSAIYRKDRAATYDALISYHNAAALHEHGAWRYRLLRLFREIEKHFVRAKDGGRARAIRNLREQFRTDSIDVMRDEHVHGAPYVPPLLAQIGFQKVLGNISQRAANKARKQTALAYARMWKEIAAANNRQEDFIFDVIELIVTKNPSDLAAVAALKRLGKKHSIRMKTLLQTQRAK